MQYIEKHSLFFVTILLGKGENAYLVVQQPLHFVINITVQDVIPLAMSTGMWKRHLYTPRDSFSIVPVLPQSFFDVAGIF